MPMFPGNTHLDSNPRSFSRLVVSHGDSPAEHWRVDSTLPVLFKYEMGGAGQTDVVVPMGFAVAATGQTTRDYLTGRQIPVIAIAGMRAGFNPIGIAQYNFIQQVDGKLTGNQPSILTRDYIELPYFPQANDAKNCKWGATYGSAANIRPGQYVRAFRHGEDTDMYVGTNVPALAGKLTWWNPATDSPAEIVGQILGINDTGSASAWLEWVMWADSTKHEDNAFMNQSSNIAPNVSGRPFDPRYSAGTLDTAGYLSEYTTNPQGLKAITDGDNISSTLFSRKEFGVIVNGTANGVVTTMIAPQKNLIIDNDFAIFANNSRLTYSAITGAYEGDPLGVTAPAVSAKVDAQKGWVTVTTTRAATQDIILSMTYRAKQFGTPGYWNFTGAVGGVRILLKF